MSDPKANYRALLERRVLRWEVGNLVPVRLPQLLRAALENVYADHRCCGEDLRCHMAKAALERLWNAIK